MSGKVQASEISANESSQVTGSGTANTIAMWTSATSIGNSQITQTAGGTGISFTPASASTGAQVAFTFTKPNYTGQTTATEINGWLMTSGSRQWVGGDFAKQREFYITSPTYSFTTGTTIGNAYTFYALAPTAGLNATFTNSWAAGFNGNVENYGKFYLGDSVTSEIYLYNSQSGSQLEIKNKTAGYNSCEIILGTTGSVSELHTNGPAWSMNNNLRFDTASISNIYVNNGSNGLRLNGRNDTSGTYGITIADDGKVTIGANYLTSSLLLGGAAVGSTISLQGTTANGTSTVAAINFLVGNNGATTAGSFYNSGQLNIGNYASPTAQRLVTIGQDTAFMSFGSQVGATSQPAIYLNQSSPSSTNFAVRGTANLTHFNSLGDTRLSIGNSLNIRLLPGITSFMTDQQSGVALSSFTFSPATHVVQTLSTAIPQVLYTMANTQWATGALAATQPFFSITQPTISFVGSSTATLTATLSIAGAPNSGTNAIQTTSVGLLVQSAAVNGTGTVGTSYGAYINAQTGATTNYAAGFGGDLFSTGTSFNWTSGATVSIGNTDAQNFQIKTSGTVRAIWTTSQGMVIGATSPTFLGTLNINVPTKTSTAWTTNGVGIVQAACTYTDTSSSGTVVAMYGDYFGVKTFAASNATTYTSVYGTFLDNPVAGTNVTIGTKYVLGINGKTWFNGTLVIADGVGVSIGSSTGTQWGAAGSNKQAWWGATPIIQPTTGVAAATFTANTSLIANDTATFDGYTIGQVVKALRNTGLLA